MPFTGMTVNSAHHRPAESRLIRTVVSVSSPKGLMVTRARLIASRRPPPRYPRAQPREETPSRSSGLAIRQSRESYTTWADPRHTAATIMSPTPSCQLLPTRKNMKQAASEPAHAKAPSSLAGRGERSAMAPTKMRTIAERMVAAVTV